MATAANDEIPAWYDDQVQAAEQDKLRKIKLPHMLKMADQQYNTSFYVPYDYAKPNPGTLVSSEFTTHRIYNGYKLSSDRNIQHGGDLPAGEAVRLDDYHCFLAGRATPFKDLHKNFHSVFDKVRHKRTNPQDRKVLISQIYKRKETSVRPECLRA